MQNQYYQGQSGSGSIYGPPGQTGSGSIYGPPGQTGGGSLYGAQGQNQSYTQNQYTQPPNQQYSQNQYNPQQYQQYPPNQFSQPMVQQYQQPQNMGNLTMLHSHPFTQSIGNGRKCDNCQAMINGPSTQCGQCNINLCLQCANKLMYQNPTSQKHQHPLQLTKRSAFNCDICKNSKSNSVSLYCKQCDFDTCIDCYFSNFPQQQQMYPQQQQMYPQQQQMYPQQPQMYPPQQQMYPQQQMFPQQPQMYPPQQTYPQQQMFPQQGMNQQTVFKSAPSSYSPQISAGQQFSGSFSGQIIPHIHPVLSQIFANNYYCDMCKKRGDGSICYSCRQCDMDICQNCCSRLLYAPKNNRHQHQLYLTKRSGWVCDICKGRNKNLSMYCQQCDFDCCTNCYSLGYNAVDSCSIM